MCARNFYAHVIERGRVERENAKKEHDKKRGAW